MSNLKALISFLVIGSAAFAENAPLQGLDRIEKAEPWEAVGRLDTATGFCTATLIAPDLVLTAAHCTFAPRSGQPAAPGDLTFRAGFRNGAAQAVRKVVQIARADGYVYNGPDHGAKVRTDVALLRLATPIASHVIDPFLVEQRPVASGPVAVVSYGEGRSELPSLQKECQVQGTFDGIVAMDCDVTFGSSGAPVFLRTLGKVRIASVISGMAEVGGDRYTVGMALPAIVNALKAQLRASGPVPVAQVRRIGIGNRSGTGAKFVTAGGS